MEKANLWADPAGAIENEGILLGTRLLGSGGPISLRYHSGLLRFQLFEVGGLVCNSQIYGSDNTPGFMNLYQLAANPSTILA